MGKEQIKMAEVSFIQTSKTVSETLSELRKIFKKLSIEDWEAIPSEANASYSVRYLRGGNWTEIGSTVQPTKAMNIRVCFQVIDNMFRWEARGVSGIIKGTAFMGGALVATQGNDKKESFEEACAILGVDPIASMEEIDKVFKIKVQFVHPDKEGGDSERFKRLQKAYNYVKEIKAK